MFGNNKTGKFLLAGLAAFAWYKYSKMSAEEKTKMTSNLKEKGKRVYDQYVPKEVKFIETKTSEYKGEKKRFYLFKIVYAYDEEDDSSELTEYLGIVGAYSTDSKDIKYDGKGIALFYFY